VALSRAAAQRRRIYLAMVALAAVVIVAALIAVWHAVGREIEMAGLKAKFVAGISHELKTPLSIIGFISQKLHLGRYSSEEEVREYYAMLSEESNRLRSLIDDVLDFSRMLENRAPYAKQSVELAPLIDDCLQRIRQSASPRVIGLTSTSEKGLAVTGDREALARALLNLLDNAIKYSPVHRTQIAVRSFREGNQAVIEIEDQGFGISDDERALVFDRFYRGRSAGENPDTKGVGLGLSIVHHIVAAHQGSISVRRAAIQGSIFQIVLPLEAR